MVKICVSGAKGKMGQRIIELSKDDPGIKLSGAFDVGDDAKGPIGEADCLIEFTAPDATIEHLAICEKLGKAIVIGTTGISDDDRARIKEASKSIAVVFSPNMSVGVNLVFKMVRDAARTLGDGYNIEIVEAHHAQKKDAPSGTAKEMVRIIKDVKGDIGIPVESIREDDIVGEHTVTFDGALDTVEITHSAKTRDIFAQGALKAAKFVSGRKAGLYSMQEVLGFKAG